MFKILPNTKEILKELPKTFKILQKVAATFAKSGHTELKQAAFSLSLSLSLTNLTGFEYCFHDDTSDEEVRACPRRPTFISKCTHCQYLMPTYLDYY